MTLNEILQDIRVMEQDLLTLSANTDGLDLTIQAEQVE